LALLVLKNSVVALEGVTLVSEVAVVKEKSDRFIVKVKERATVVGTSIDLLKTAPFISVSGSNEISLQGKPTLVLVGNKPIPDSSVESILQMIPAGNIVSMELITNPSAKYDAMYGAVVNIITRNKHSDGYTGNFRALGALGRYGDSL
jgi:outer membrane receptor for ferrienterochelin and colicin